MHSQIAHSIENKIRTNDILITENVDFTAMLLTDKVLKGLAINGFKKPSPIQLKAIPMGRCGFDLILKAKSGTGKTAVFGIIALETVDINKDDLQILILAPTREIAVQIKDVILSIGKKFNGLKVEYFIGGTPTDEDKVKLKKCHIAVGAPGRVKHLVKNDVMKLDFVRLFVLDEADKLMSDSYQKDINFIYNKLGPRKQIIASSATYPDKLDKFLENYMKSPITISPNTDVPILLGLRQFVTTVKSHLNVIQQMALKTNELIRILQNVSFNQCIIFSNYQTRAETLSNNLSRLGWPTIYISGAMKQQDRLEAVSSLKEFKCRILSTTDLTARGIDAANVDLVINYEVPNDPETYLHRMGRAGRYGSTGICITIATEDIELEKFQKLLGKISDNLLAIKLPADEIPQDIWTCDLENFEKISGIKRNEIETICNTINELSVFNEEMDLENLKNSDSESTPVTNINSEIKFESVSCDNTNNNLNEELNSDEQMKKDIEIEENNIVHKNIALYSVAKLIVEEDSKTEECASHVENFLKILEEEDKIETNLSKNKIPFTNLLNCPKNVLSDDDSVNLDSFEQLKVENMLSNLNREDVLLKDDIKSKFSNLKPSSILNLLTTNLIDNSISQIVKNTSDNKIKKSKNKKAKFNETVDDSDEINSEEFDSEAKLFQRNNICTMDQKQEEDKIVNSSCDCSPNIFADAFDFAISKSENHWQNKLCQQHFSAETVEEKDNEKEENEDEYMDDYAESEQICENFEPEIIADEDIFVKAFDYALCSEETCEENYTEKEDFNEEACGYAAAYTFDHLNLTSNNVRRKHKIVPPLPNDYEYVGAYDSIYEQYDNLLAQNGPQFCDVNSFEKWFKQWQEGVYSVRNFIQKDVFVKEKLTKTDY